MAHSDTLRYKRIPLTDGSGMLPAVGFGTLIPDLGATEHATRTALEVGSGILIALNDTETRRRLVMRCGKPLRPALFAATKSL